MKAELLPKGKLSLIADIWNSYILEYKYCQAKIKYTKDVQSNYFGDILRYFLDSFEVLSHSPQEEKSFLQNFEGTISFLQVIYIQQDFVEELLHIFKCKITRGDLNKDPNFRMNREIRNELIGHPVRKTKGKNPVLLSSTIFSNSLNNSQIAYIIYHKDNNYKSQHHKYKKEEITIRHYDFLNYYFDIIIKQLKVILRKFLKELEVLAKSISLIPFEGIVRKIGHIYEAFLEYDPLYKSEILLEAYKKKDEHIRYENAINYFVSNLNRSLNESIENINEIINKQINKTDNTEKTIFYEADYTEIENNNSLGEGLIYKKNSKASPIQKVDYHYEMGKLISMRNLEDFIFFSSLLRSKCKSHLDILNELDNMESNLHNKLEYYCSYHLINKLLNR